MDIKWLNQYSKSFLEKDYLLPGQTVQDRLKVIGDAAEKILGVDGYSEKLQQYIANGWISLSTPMWTNFGTSRGLPISCFGVYVDDSVESILSSVAEIGTMSKYGGGTSGYFGALRGRGSEITYNGHSNGSKAFLELFQSCAQSMNQGSVRRGYFSAYQDIDHPDFEEWLNIRAEGDPIQHITWGVCVSDEWLESMKAGDAKKRKIWARVIQKKFETGLPYIFYTDNANNHESVPEVYRGKNKIKASQMCLAGNTVITIILNGEEQKVDIKTAIDLFKEGNELLVKSFCTQTNVVEFTKILNGALMNKNAEVLQIEDDLTGKIIICTPEHRVYTSNRGYVMAKDLEESDELTIFNQI